MSVRPYALYKYANYEEYVATQTHANKFHRKIRRPWVERDTVRMIVEYLRQRVKDPELGLCHGTRHGREQQYFLRLLPKCRVVGTEISTTATEYDNTVQWDFHEIKEEWRGAVDFIYTNSLDHAYDPQKAVRAWMQCLTENGLCFIEWWGVANPEPPVPNDPFSATYDGFAQLLQEWGYCDNYHTRDVIPLELSKRKGPARGRQGGLFVLERIKTL